MRIGPCVPMISAAAIGAALAIGSGSALAADCLTKPSRDAPSGQHWYYRLDRGTDRKCWYLHATVTGAADAPAMELQSAHTQRRQAAAPQRPAKTEEQITRWNGRLNNQVQHLSGRVLRWEPTTSI